MKTFIIIALIPSLVENGGPFTVTAKNKRQAWAKFSLDIWWKYNNKPNLNHWLIEEIKEEKVL